MSPAEVKTEEQGLKVKVWDGKEFWAVLNWDGSAVTITAQKVGEDITSQIKIPRRTFKRICEWYLKDQAKHVKRHS